MTHWNQGPRSSCYWGRRGCGGCGAILIIVQGSGNAEDALSLWVISKRATQLVALLRKETCNLRHPMHRRHPVQYNPLCLLISHFCRVLSAMALVYDNLLRAQIKSQKFILQRRHFTLVIRMEVLVQPTYCMSWASVIF